MCDTMLAPPSHTAGGVMLFAKNSDRQRNEAQTVEYFPSADHQPDATVACTYITIPQVRRKHAVLLCRPFWIWGAEMGANEHGVVIGNEAIHARSAAAERNELPGLDLVRLGLERAATAAEAVEVMTTLLEKHGAGGNCGHLAPAYFNNGFIIVDAQEAFVLEMVEREWLVERAGHPRAISNTYSIGREAERFSAGLPGLLRERGWSSDPTPHFAQSIANPNREHIGYAGARRARSTFLLQSYNQLTAASMMRILRDHGTSEGPASVDWHPEQCGQLTLCMHAGSNGRIAQTAGSMVSEVHQERAVHWVTGTAAPCTSIFKPVLLDVPLPEHGARPSDQFDVAALWWRHERLHRSAIRGDLGRFLEDVSTERDALEADFRTRVYAVLRDGSTKERSQVIAQCWQEAREMEDRWYSRLELTSSTRDGGYLAAWDEVNRLAGIDVSGRTEVTHAG